MDNWLLILIIIIIIVVIYYLFFSGGSNPLVHSVRDYLIGSYPSEKNMIPSSIANSPLKNLLRPTYYFHIVESGDQKRDSYIDKYSGALQFTGMSFDELKDAFDRGARWNSFGWIGTDRNLYNISDSGIIIDGGIKGGFNAKGFLPTDEELYKYNLKIIGNPIKLS